MKKLKVLAFAACWIGFATLAHADCGVATLEQAMNLNAADLSSCSRTELDVADDLLFAEWRRTHSDAVADKWDLVMEQVRRRSLETPKGWF